MSTKTDSSCCNQTDCFSTLLGKVGVNRSLLVTLALVPFSFNGARFIVDFCVSAWNAITSNFAQ